MSGIYISHVDIPTDRVTALFFYPGGKVEAYWAQDGKRTPELALERCAIQVPDHGRLIDADVLHEELYALEYARENEWRDGIREARGVDAARVALLDAPTIIPAEEAEA